MMPGQFARIAAVCLLMTGIALGAAVDGVSAAPASRPALFGGSAAVPPADTALRKQSRDQVIRTADWALRLDIPSEPRAAAKRKADGSYSSEGLVSAKTFLHAGVAIQWVMPVLGTASRLTSDPKYAARAVEWLDAYSRWSRFDVGKADIAGAGSLVGLAVGYDFFHAQLSNAQRTRVLAVVERLTRDFVSSTAKLTRVSLADSRSQVASNHNVVPACAAGIGALLLKLEGRDNGGDLDKVIATFRNAILPAAFSPEGEYSEGTGIFFDYVVTSMTLFFEGVRRNGGPNLWKEGHVRKVPEFMIRAEQLSAEDAPFNYRVRFSLLAMASVYRDRELQGLALREEFRVGPRAKEQSFPQKGAPRLDAKDARPWYSSAWEYMFYDTSVEPAPLTPRPLGVVFPNLGRAILRSSWARTASVLTFKSGPRTGKDAGDNNAFELHAFGAGVLPGLEASLPPLEERGDEAYAEMSKILGTEGSNTILVDGRGQFSQFAPKSKGVARHSDWLAGASGASKAPGHITGFAHSAVVDYVGGEAANAYQDDDGRRALDRFRRHIFFVKDEYVIIIDDIKTAGGPRDIEWRFHGGRDNRVSAAGPAFTFDPAGGGEGAASLRPLRPKLAGAVKTLDVRRKEYATPFASLRVPNKQGQPLAIFAIELQRRPGAAGREIAVVRDDDALVVIRAGQDMLVWNKSRGAAEWESLRFSGQAAWLRPEAAAVLVEGSTLDYKGARLIQSGQPAAVWSPR